MPSRVEELIDYMQGAADTKRAALGPYPRWDFQMKKFKPYFRTPGQRSRKSQVSGISTVSRRKKYKKNFKWLIYENTNTNLNVGTMYDRNFLETLTNSTYRGGQVGNRIYLDHVVIKGYVHNPNTARTDVGKMRFLVVQDKQPQTAPNVNTFLTPNDKAQAIDFGGLPNYQRTFLPMANFRWFVLFDKLYNIKCSSTGESGPKNTHFNIKVPIKRYITFEAGETNPILRIYPHFKILYWFEADGNTTFTSPLTNFYHINYYYHDTI